MGVAGFTIGYFFMNSENLSFSLYWMFLHIIGGIVGGVISITLVEALKIRMKSLGN